MPHCLLWQPLLLQGTDSGLLCPTDVIIAVAFVVAVAGYGQLCPPVEAVVGVAGYGLLCPPAGDVGVAVAGYGLLCPPVDDGVGVAGYGLLCPPVEVHVPGLGCRGHQQEAGQGRLHPGGGEQGTIYFIDTAVLCIQIQTRTDILQLCGSVFRIRIRMWIRTIKSRKFQCSGADGAEIIFILGPGAGAEMKF